MLLGLAGLLGCGDSQNPENEPGKFQTTTSPTLLEEYAQEHKYRNSHSAEFAYIKALYFNNLKIIETNKKILQEKGLNVDISDLMKKAEQAQKYGQEHMYGSSRPAKFKYLEAVSLTDKIIMKQQEALIKK